VEESVKSSSQHLVPAAGRQALRARPNTEPSLTWDIYFFMLGRPSD
jgi:hypothetical protein